MQIECPGMDPFLDGELPEAEAKKAADHVASCASCAAELESLRALKAALSRVRLPSPPRRFSLRPARRSPLRTLSAAAAVLVTAASVLFSLPAPIPEVVALTAQFHDYYLAGRVTPRDIGLKVSLPGADYLGQCPCPPELGSASPFIVYRKGDTPISLLLSESPPGELPESARRSREGRDYHAFRVGANTIILCRSEKLSHIWVSRLGEEDLVRTLLATNEGRRLFAGERLTLEGIT